MLEFGWISQMYHLGYLRGQGVKWVGEVRHVLVLQLITQQFEHLYLLCYARLELGWISQRYHLGYLKRTQDIWTIIAIILKQMPQCVFQ